MRTSDIQTLRHSQGDATKQIVRLNKTKYEDADKPHPAGGYIFLG